MPGTAHPASRLHGGRQRHLERRLYEIVSRTAQTVGEAYFRLLAETMTDALPCNACVIAEQPRGGPGSLRPITVYAGRTARDVAELPLAGSFAEACAGGTGSVLVTRASETNPNDPLLAAMAAESCVAVAVHDATGAMNGLLGVADTDEFDDPLAIEAILRLVAARVGAEIERRQANVALQEQAEMTRAMMDRAEDIILRVRPGRPPIVEYVNPAFERITGYTADELRADPQLLLRMAHPEDRDSFGEALLEGDMAQPTVWRWMRRDGRALWTEGRRTSFSDSEGRLVVEAVTRDITAQKDAEARAEAAHQREVRTLSAVPDAILHIGRDCVITGYRPPRGSVSPFGEDIVGTRLADALPEEPEVVAQIAMAFDTGVAQTHRFDRRIGETDRVFACRTALLDSDQLVMFVRDVTGEEFIARAAAKERSREELEGRAGRQILRKNPYSLTFREFSVLELVASGMSDKQIAAELGISLNTVGKHVSNILGKMQVGSRTEATARALHEHLLD